MNFSDSGNPVVSFVFSHEKFSLGAICVFHKCRIAKNGHAWPIHGFRYFWSIKARNACQLCIVPAPGLADSIMNGFTEEVENEQVFHFFLLQVTILIGILKVLFTMVLTLKPTLICYCKQSLEKGTKLPVLSSNIAELFFSSSVCQCTRDHVACCNFVAIRRS